MRPLHNLTSVKETSMIEEILAEEFSQKYERLRHGLAALHGTQSGFG